MNSTPSNALNGAGAGVNGRETWSLIVKAREIGENRLGLVIGGEDAGRNDVHEIETGKKCN